jgi:hypothetical protein
LGQAQLARPFAGPGQRAPPACALRVVITCGHGQSGHRRLNADEGVEQTEGKWSLDLGLTAAIRKPRRGGREGGAHQERALLRRRARQRGGDFGERPKKWSRWPKKWLGRSSLAARSLLQGRRGGGRSERAAIGEAFVEEDGGGEIPWPGFASRRCGQALGVGGAQGRGTPFGQVGQLEVARQRWATVGEAAAGME